MFESTVQAQPMTQPLVYFWCRAAERAGKFNTFTGRNFWGMCDVDAAVSQTELYTKFW